MNAASPPRPPGSLWRHPDFLKLWSAETISQFGTQVSVLAVPLVAIWVLEASTFEVALLSAIEFLPFILLSLPAGAWVDRLRRRPILIIGDLGRAISLGSIPVAYALGLLTVPQLYVVGFVNGVLTVFFDVAYQSYLPSLVERDQILDGNSKLEVSRTLAQTAGPAIGGGLIGIVTAPIAILVDSISFLGSALFVYGIRRHEPAPDRHSDEHGQPRRGLRHEVAEGLHFVLGNRYLRSIAACTASANLFGNMIFAIYLVYVVRVLGLDAPTIGVVLGIANIGGVAGAVGANRIGLRVGVGPTIVASSALAGVATLLLPLASHALAIPLLLASGLVSSFANVVYNITQVSFRQAITPERIQGRMNATMRFIVWGTIPIGSTIGGILGAQLGLVQTMWIGALLGSFVFLFVLLSPVRSLRVMPSPAWAATEHGIAAVTDVLAATADGDVFVGPLVAPTPRPDPE
jgi:MFS family permease